MRLSAGRRRSRARLFRGANRRCRSHTLRDVHPAAQVRTQAVPFPPRRSAHLRPCRHWPPHGYRLLITTDRGRRVVTKAAPTLTPAPPAL